MVKIQITFHKTIKKNNILVGLSLPDHHYSMSSSLNLFFFFCPTGATFHPGPAEGAAEPYRERSGRGLLD